eukprot:1363931-Amorphochlora_amoeboformis.AAC.1
MDLLALVVAIICVVIAFLMFGSSKVTDLTLFLEIDLYPQLTIPDNIKLHVSGCLINYHIESYSWLYSHLDLSSEKEIALEGDSRPISESERGGKRCARTTFHKSLEFVNLALQKAGLESSDLIIGIDYTKSNEWNGKNSFGGRSLHYMPNDQFVGNVAGAPGGSIFGNQAVMNPYQAVIDMIGRTLEKFDDDSRIPVFGFGDAKTQDHSVFPLSDCKDGLCNGIPEVLKRYAE